MIAEGQIERLRDAIASVIGVVVRPEVSAIEDFCRKRFARSGIQSIDEYVTLLSSTGFYGKELTALADHFAVRESHFYRDPKQLAAIAGLVVSRYQKERRPLSVWIAGCANGEEAYTLAIIGRLAGVPLQIVGTDINENLIANAVSGRFGRWSMRNLPPDILHRFFTVAGEEATIDESIRHSVAFRVHNLLDSAPLLSQRNGGAWDVVLCRNVLIYFDEAMVRDTASRIALALAPDGILFVSSAESLHGKTPLLRTVTLEQGFAYAPVREAFATAAVAAPSTARTPLRERGPYEAISASLEGLPSDGATAVLRAAQREDVHGTLFLAGLLLDQRKPDDAAAVLVTVREEGEFLAEMHYLLGWAQRLRDDASSARDSLRKAVFLDGRFWPALYTLAKMLKDFRDFAAASALYRRTLELIEQRHLPDDREYLPGVRELCAHAEDVKKICRSFA